MKKSIPGKLRLKKDLIAFLNKEEQHQLNGGSGPLTLTNPTRDFKCDLETKVCPHPFTRLIECPLTN